MIAIGILCWGRVDYVMNVILPAITRCTVDTYLIAVSCNSKHALEKLATERYLRPQLLGTGKNLGVAGGKNRLICWFKNTPSVDHLFLFEDDCEPTKHGWDQWFIDGHRATGVQAVTYQPHLFYGGVTGHGPRSASHEAVGTCIDGMTLLSATRKAIDCVGGFHPAFYGVNGQEHSEWMTRANRAGMAPFTNCSFMGCEEWVDGIDHREWRKTNGLPGGRERPPGDPATLHVYGDKHYDKGRETFFRVKKSHRIGELYQDPCADEASLPEVAKP